MNSLLKFDRKHKHCVTIIVGIICKDGIVMAADSKTTLDDDGHTRNDTEKLHLLQLRKRRAIVGRSGHDALSMRAIEVLESRAQGADVTDYRFIAELASGSMDQVKMDLRREFPGSVDALWKHFNDHAFAMMVGYYHGRQPYLYSVDFVLGISSPKRSGYLAIGCGAPLAEYILKGMDTSQMTPEQAFATAIYIIEEVKEFDDRCGGPVRTAISSWWKGKLHTACFERAVPERTIAAIREHSKKLRLEWTKGIQEVIERVQPKPPRESA